MDSTKPTAAERERSKTDLQRAEDVAYTINHSLVCTATDFVDPFVGNATQKFLGKRYSISGHGHDHIHNFGHSHLKENIVGEFVGDFGAVPVTVAIQRYFPGAMHVIGKMLEPVLGGYFRRGAERSARKEGLAPGTGEFRDRVSAIYSYEMEHLPQAAVWTATSVGVNLATQKLMHNPAPLAHIAIGKAMGAAISTGLVVGTRGLMPDTAHRWDRFTSERAFLPVTKTVSKFFGVNERAVDRMAQKQKQREANWAERVEGSTSASERTKG